MQMALGLEQAHAAGEDEIRAGQQARSSSTISGGAPRERGKLVHAVVDDQRGADVVGKLSANGVK